MKLEIVKAAIKYCDDQNLEGMSHGLLHLTSGEEDIVFNAFIHGAEYIIKKEGLI